MARKAMWKVFADREEVERGVREGNKLVAKALAKKQYLAVVKCKGGYRLSHTKMGTKAEKIIGSFRNLKGKPI